MQTGFLIAADAWHPATLEPRVGGPSAVQVHAIATPAPRAVQLAPGLRSGLVRAPAALPRVQPATTVAAERGGWAPSRGLCALPLVTKSARAGSGVS